MSDDDMIRRGDAGSIILLGGSPVGMLERLNALPAVSAPVAVRVKPLEWGDALLGHGIFRAKDGLGGYYEVAERSDGFQTCLVIKMGGGFISHHPTLDAAKSAAQADYAARIMAAIDAPDVAELVKHLQNLLEACDALGVTGGNIEEIRAALRNLGEDNG